MIQFLYKSNLKGVFMRAYLFVDFGSTNTKLTLVDIEKEEIIATSRAFTTVETDVMEGFTKGFEDLKSKIGEDFQIEKVSCCSSAAGGLQIIAIGLVPALTAEAAKRAALGAGAKITGVYTHELNRSEIQEIIASKPDIVLLAGGTDGGNKEVVIHNSKQLRDHGISCPVVYAGNKSAIDDVEDIFNSCVELYVTENVMPRINELNVEPCRETIREIFMEKIVHAKGMDRVQERLGDIVMPTPAAVLKAAETLSVGSKNEPGLGDLAVVDIGGATTDIHSIAKGWPSNPSVSFKGLEEPFAKRTVEGDLGMRYSSAHVAEDNEEMLKSYLGDKWTYDIDKEIMKRTSDPGYLAEDERELNFDIGLARVAARLAMTRHAGFVKEVYSPLGPIYQQTGKDLLELPAVIGTGGVLVSTAYPYEILSSTVYNQEEGESLKPRDPKFYKDGPYVMSAMGLLSMIDEDMAIRLMKKILVEVQPS